MVMFLHQSHMIRKEFQHYLPADSDLTSTLSGISFQSSKPSDYGSSGGGSSGQGHGGNAVVDPTFCEFDNFPKYSNGLMNPGPSHNFGPTE